MSDADHAPAVRVRRIARRGGRFLESDRAVPEECAVALTYNGTTHAVMMASPHELEDFAVGFSLTEGIVQALGDIEEVAAVPAGDGIDLQIRLRSDLGDAYARRRRAIAGPAGCGLCGIESIEAALKPARIVGSGLTVLPAEMTAAVAELGRRQPLNAETGATHAAGFWQPGRGLVLVREDVGRHIALDKLVGALARLGLDPSQGGLVLTSRVSVEMVQKAAAAGIPLIAAVSAPTALAIATAEAAGLTLAALVRGDEFDLFTHPERIDGKAAAHVA